MKRRRIPITPKRIHRQSDRFHVSYSFMHDGWFLYVRYPQWWIRLFGWSLKIAGKQPYRRVNDAPYKDEELAWSALERDASLRGDWHAVGYARAMRQTLCWMRGETYSDVYIYPYDREHGKGPAPAWVNDLYLVPKEKSHPLLPSSGMRIRDVLLNW